MNGSDPVFLRSFEETDLGLETHPLDKSPQRYQGLLHSFSFDNETCCLLAILRDPSAEGTGRKVPSYVDETLLPN